MEKIKIYYKGILIILDEITQTYFVFFPKANGDEFKIKCESRYIAEKLIDEWSNDKIKAKYDILKKKKNKYITKG